MTVEEAKLEHADKWHGEYRSVRYLVSRHGVTQANPKGIWWYYIYVPLQRLPDSARLDWLQEPQVMSERPNQSPVKYRPYPSVDIELHGGCTYYRVHESDGNAPVGEIGCDYNHAWDQDRYYDLTRVDRDCKRSIDCLWDIYPDLRRECWYCGGYHSADEGHDTDRGWITFECEKKLAAVHATEP